MGQRFFQNISYPLTFYIVHDCHLPILNVSLNHYVPDFVIRNFADTNGVLWILDKTTSHIWCKKASVKSKGTGYDAFAEHAYNPITTEDQLAELERKTAPIIREIIENARTQTFSVLDQNDKEYLCAFLLVQTLRIPRVKDFATRRDWGYPQGRDLLWQMLKAICTKDLPNGLSVDIADPQLTEHPHFELIVWKRMTDMVLDVLCISDPTATNFVIGDEPCLRKGWLLQSDDCVVMPISKNVFIQFSFPEDSSGELSDCSLEMTNALNAQTFQNSQRFVAGSDPLYLKQLLDHKRQSSRHLVKKIGALRV